MARPQPAVVELERCGVTQVVTLRGRHDAATMPAVVEALRQALTAPPVNGARLVMVDVGSVESCDGALAATLVSAHDDHCGDGDTVLVLAVRRRSGSAAGRLLVSSGACDVIPTFNGRDAALAALEVAYLEALWAYSARRA